ncbi:hypothetical protein DPMN_154442 [Dreissena polymorpha]|uniref:Uncharacterized protein n=1 Tax=Dreissena polymorpha TaxID=45954 RepID=A0A9D4FKF9_DREPO|nr:hypothetical protein DPMN_154442 [Dreissena polymorpha]
MASPLTMKRPVLSLNDQHPKTLRRQFLGFAGFYRRYVELYALIVEPLNELLKGHDTTGRASKRKKRSKKTNKPAVLSWADTQDPLFCTQAHQVMALVLSFTKIRMEQKRSLHMPVVAIRESRPSTKARILSVQVGSYRQVS